MEDLSMTNFLTIEDIKKKLPIHEAQIRRYIKSGKLRASKFGRSYLIREEDFNDFLKSYVKNVSSPNN